MCIPLEVIHMAVMFGWQRVVVVDGYRVLLEERSCIDTLITMLMKCDGLQMFRHHMRCNTRMQKCLRQSPTCDGEYRHVLYDAQRYTTQTQPQRRLFFDRAATVAAYSISNVSHLVSSKASIVRSHPSVVDSRCVMMQNIRKSTSYHISSRRV